jgi:hypothetical protein
MQNTTAISIIYPQDFYVIPTMKNLLQHKRCCPSARAMNK